MARFFSNSYLTKKELRKSICEFAKARGVKRVCFNSRAKRVWGSYTAATKVIFLSNTATKTQMLKAFFHELGHHVTVESKRFLAYHNGETTPATRVFFIENRVDRTAKRLWNAYVNVNKWGKYSYNYPKSLKTYFIESFTHEHN